MRLTVALCTWNRCALLRETLESLSSLSIPDGIEWDIVVVNNNSTDDTEAVLKSFRSRLPLRPVFEPRQGISPARNAAIAVLFSSILICLYLTLQFRHVQHPARYGVAAIAALLHDVLVVLGLASLIGHFMGWEIDALFLTALLTVIGFSVHDSIVVFDRIRENSGRLRGLPFERIVNHSIVQTLDRSINTQLTALFTLFAIYVFSTGQLHRFLFWLIIGLISGTYSSIANAAPILVIWSNREWNHWFGRGKDEGLVTAG